MFSQVYSSTAGWHKKEVIFNLFSYFKHSCGVCDRENVKNVKKIVLRRRRKKSWILFAISSLQRAYKWILDVITIISSPEIWACNWSFTKWISTLSILHLISFEYPTFAGFTEASGISHRTDMMTRFTHCFNDRSKFWWKFIMIFWEISWSKRWHWTYLRILIGICCSSWWFFHGNRFTSFVR